MGTRSLTYMQDELGRNIVCMYRQYDGYPNGHGLQLARFLDGFTVCNGYNQAKTKLANGMGCLAAQMVAHFKDGTGNIYLHFPSPPDPEGWQEYVYWVSLQKVKVTDHAENPLFHGTWKEFLGWCSKPEPEEV